MMKALRRVFLIIAFCLPTGLSLAVQTPDAEYEAVAEEYIKSYLAARPLLGTSLGFHEYDGKISDYSRLSLDAELSRLRRFDDRLKKFDLAKLSQRQSIDLRILQAAIKKEIFQRQDMAIFERDPAVYVEGMKLGVVAVASCAIDIKPLLTHRFSLEEINRAFSLMKNREPGFCKAIIEP